MDSVPHFDWVYLTEIPAENPQMNDQKEQQLK